MIRITEIFHSIQGESSHVGRPCVFVRLTGCNLRCRWCDSEYTFTGGEKMSLEDVLARVAAYGCRLVEVTGGEPLAQAESLDLIKRLLDEAYEVLIETSGSIDVGPVDRRAKLILDIKCPGSGEVARNRWGNLEHLTPGHDEVKFVLAGREDYQWARGVIAERGLERFTILFSPVWGELELKLLAEWMLADRVPARLQTQLHKHIWGSEARGV
ncbi:MAG TPA: radical SAM protein [Thermoanaerobaculia bacterium]|jgi:7-carboxy-7-deazaguanine synthase|nr:radical SAM protein [Thermoanaerobaculia bacterium]